MAYTQKNNPFKQKTSTVTTSDVSQSDMNLAQKLNKMRFEMGQHYPIISEEQIREDEKKQLTAPMWDKKQQHAQYEMKKFGISYEEFKKRALKENVRRELDKTAQTEKERKELYARDPSGEGYDIDKFRTYINPASSEERFRSKEGFNKWLYEKDLKFIETAKKAGGETFDKITSLPNKDLVGFQNEVIRVAKPLIGKKLREDPVYTLGEIKKLDLSGFKQYLKKANVNKNDIKNIITAQINNMPDYNKDGTPDIFEGIKGKVLRSGVNTLIEHKLKDLE